MTFLGTPVVSGLQPCDQNHLKKHCTIIVLLMGRMTNQNKIYDSHLSSTDCSFSVSWVIKPILLSNYLIGSFIFLCWHKYTSCNTLSNILSHHHHHHGVLVARISLTLSRHFSLSFIASGRSSGQHPISSHSCWMYVRAGRPAFARPCVGVHKLKIEEYQVENLKFGKV